MSVRTATSAGSSAARHLAVSVALPIAVFAAYLLWAAVAPTSFRSVVLTESGIIEVGTAAFFAVAAALGTTIALRRIPTLYRLYFGGFAFAFLVVALEEVSYGQHIFKWRSPEFFEQHSSQNETNLHNLGRNKPARRIMDLAEVGSTTLFVLLPAAMTVLGRRRARRPVAAAASADIPPYTPPHWSFYVLPHFQLVAVVGLARLVALMRKWEAVRQLPGLQSPRELHELREFYIAWAALGYVMIIWLRLRERTAHTPARRSH